MLCADGTALASDATVWTAGFAVGPIAAASGLEVTGDGRIVVDRTMRSVSHPEVYAAGDSAYALGDNGRPLPMSCASAGYTGRQATNAIVGRLTGRKDITDHQAGVRGQPHQPRAAGRDPPDGRRRRAGQAGVRGRPEGRADPRRASSRCRCGPPRIRPSGCPGARTAWPPCPTRPPSGAWPPRVIRVDSTAVDRFDTSRFEAGRARLQARWRTGCWVPPPTPRTPCRTRSCTGRPPTGSGSRCRKRG